MFTIYEYLEHRFSLAVRTVGSLLLQLMREVWLATAIYTQVLALGSLIGIAATWAVTTTDISCFWYSAVGSSRHSAPATH